MTSSRPSTRGGIERSRRRSVSVRVSSTPPRCTPIILAPPCPPGTDTRSDEELLAAIEREAISCYRPTPKRDRNFALAGNFERIDADAHPISEIPEDELMRGFGE